METAAIIQAAAGISSVILAIAALLHSQRVEKQSRKLADQQFLHAQHADKRAQEFAEQQLEISRRLIRPLLGIFTDNFTGFLTVEIRNHGAGTAIITNVKLWKDKAEHDCLPKFLNVATEHWDHFWIFNKGPIYLSANDSISLLRLSRSVLEDEGYDEPAAILEDVRNKLNGICIEAQYTDILDAAQQPLSVALKI